MERVTLHLHTHEAESVLDATLRPEDAEYPEYPDAFRSVQQRAEQALNHEAVEPSCPVCAGYAVDQAIAVLHSALIRAAAEADVLILGNTLHVLDGCWRARQAHPLAVRPGGYVGRPLPVFATQREGERWLTVSSRRKRCRRCAPEDAD